MVAAHTPHAQMPKVMCIICIFHTCISTMTSCMMHIWIGAISMSSVCTCLTLHIVCRRTREESRRTMSHTMLEESDAVLVHAKDDASITTADDRLSNDCPSPAICASPAISVSPAECASYESVRHVCKEVLDDLSDEEYTETSEKECPCESKHLHEEGINSDILSVTDFKTLLAFASAGAKMPPPSLSEESILTMKEFLSPDVYANIRSMSADSVWILLMRVTHCMRQVATALSAANNAIQHQAQWLRQCYEYATDSYNLLYGQVEIAQLSDRKSREELQRVKQENERLVDEKAQLEERIRKLLDEKQSMANSLSVMREEVQDLRNSRSDALLPRGRPTHRGRNSGSRHHSRTSESSMANTRTSYVPTNASVPGTEVTYWYPMPMYPPQPPLLPMQYSSHM